MACSCEHCLVISVLVGVMVKDVEAGPPMRRAVCRPCLELLEAAELLADVAVQRHEVGGGGVAALWTGNSEQVIKLSEQPAQLAAEAAQKQLALAECDRALRDAVAAWLSEELL
jgi:hypothetical protein